MRRMRVWWQMTAALAMVIAVVVTMVLAARQRQADDPDRVDCALVKCVALTFDDGPTPFADRLVQVLRSYNAKATFFLIGNKVAAEPANHRYPEPESWRPAVVVVGNWTGGL